MLRKRLSCAWAVMALAVVLLVAASWSSASPTTVPSTSFLPSPTPTVLQPSLKRNVYVFFDRFLDRTNTTSPAAVVARLTAVNAYFAEVTHGAWSFNWTLFYPALGSSWYLVNETYAQAGASSNLTPLAQVITAANNSGVTFPPPGRYPLVPSALIIHAGDDGAMTGNTTDIWSVTTGPYCSGFRTNPPNAFCLLTAIVAETDPVGVIAHELTHELERFDEFGNPMGITLGHSTGTLPAGMIPIDWWDPMYQGLRNPVNNVSIPRGTYPSEYMAWNRMSLGFLPLSQIAVVGRGQTASVTLDDLEEPSSGYQAIRIPISNSSLSHSYYFVELRKGVSYDAYFPWLTALYPNRIGMLIYWVNVGQYGEPFHIFLMKAHTTDVTAQQALFGPCSAPCTPAMSFVDPVGGVNVSITSASDSAFVVQVSSVATTPSSTSACPSLSCLVGFIDLGVWGLVLNVVLVLGAALAVVALGIRRRRLDRIRSDEGAGEPHAEQR